MATLTPDKSTVTFNQMDFQNKISRSELIKKLGIGYQTAIRYENEYEWIPKAQAVKGSKEVFYKKEDVKQLLKTLLSLNKIGTKADRKWMDEVLFYESTSVEESN